jgi:hypothetical protein
MNALPNCCYFNQLSKPQYWIQLPELCITGSAPEQVRGDGQTA